MDEGWPDSSHPSSSYLKSDRYRSEHSELEQTCTGRTLGAVFEPSSSHRIGPQRSLSYEDATRVMLEHRSMWLAQVGVRRVEVATIEATSDIPDEEGSAFAIAIWVDDAQNAPKFPSRIRGVPIRVRAVKPPDG